MMEKSRAWIEMDRAALRHNVEALQKRLPPGCALMPAVKANAYGHGAVSIARECQTMGVDAFCAATVEEGVELRENGIRGTILVLGWTDPRAAVQLHEHKLTQTVVGLAYAQELDRLGKPIQVHVKIDTGMHRLGLHWEDLEGMAGIFSRENLRVTGAFTHICADSMAKEQGRRFYRAVAGLKGHGYNIPKIHLLASQGLINHPELGGNYARVGLALYGVGAPELRPVLSLKARVAQVRELPAGEGTGYELRFTSQRPSRIAVLAIGYGDGLPRSLSCGAGRVLLHGKRAPIAGLICMDQTLVDVTGLPHVSPGDTAVLIGKSGGSEITAAEMAEQAGTIPNEIFSRLGRRLGRHLC
ncbi:MAG: serine racemase VanT catalytic subunit [Acutalibacter sp.]|nr:serine racemase VanT catalytic subunit [Acutalibacter sp.]